MDNAILIALIGLAGSVAVNLIGPVVNARASRRKVDADAAGAAVGAAERMIEQLQKEMERRERDCDEKILALQARLEQLQSAGAQAQAQIAELTARLDARDAELERKAANLAIAVHQLKGAGIAPLFTVE